MTQGGHSDWPDDDFMESASLFLALESVNEKPRPFSVYTASELWTDEHTSEQMLAFHLDGEIDVSSRRTGFIDNSVRWLQEHFDLSNSSRVIDFGCGPGLYTSRIARLGAEVFGIDFSSRSIEYARASARRENLEVTYIEADYLDFQPEGAFDLITMIMCDFCALSPEQRLTMLEKFEGLLSDQGRIILDVYSLRAFGERQERLVCEKNQLNGFWSANPYYGFVASFKYDDEKVSLDKYTIVEQNRQREIYNWLQYFSPGSLEQEAQAAGLQVDELHGDVAGNSYDADAAEFAVVMKRR
jgi:cyclopropane fatty-acyl-phospholipid synthase-like methyltransferase